MASATQAKMDALEYNRYLERHDAYEAIRDYGIAELMAKFLSK
jgi:hypothetical protein